MSLLVRLATAVVLWGTTVARASLDAYDGAIMSDAAGGLKPIAKLTSAAVLTGANKVPFHFGTNSGDVTMEFIVQGDPSANSSAYLAVGANATSNLRFEQWNDTAQLGFTQLGVLDYLFTPSAASPIQPTHVTYLWNASVHSMQLYLNGQWAGACTGVTPDFAMPAGSGWLGANPGGGEPMVGTLHRVTVYDGRVSAEVIQAHADAFKGVIRPPVVVSFAADPEAIFTPGKATLTWNVLGALRVFVNGTDVTTLSNLTVAPSVTTVYSLIATNTAASATSQVSVVVNPAPHITRFVADRSYVTAGDAIRLSWKVGYAQTLSISPDVGDVTAQTSGGAGSTTVRPIASGTYTLTTKSPFGTNAATVDIHIVQPAPHLVISEFMADDQSTFPDENGRFPGWIEILNPTAAPISLAGCYLTDEADDPTRWAFPSTNLAAGSYLVVFASGEGRALSGASLHTNFRLKNTGEYLALVGPGPSVLHEFAPSFPPQRTDLSYGLLAGDVSLARYLGVPTPGAANSDLPPPPSPVQLSRPGGLFTEPFTVALTTIDPQAQIRFTVDGSAPGLNHGTQYEEPIPITQSTHLRAVALTEGRVGRVNGACYIRLAPDLAHYTSSLPIMVIDNFDAGTIQRKGWNANGAGIKQVPRQSAAWATFERVGGFSSLTNNPQMWSRIGIRGRGAYSTEWRQKPYSVEAMDEEGGEAEVSPLGMPRHADWILYYPDPDSSRDPTLLFNTFAYELSGAVGRYAVRFRWVEAFINEDGGDLSLSDRRGVYAIVEKVARGTDRLDFQQLSADGSSGGWLLNINRMDPEPDTGWPAANGATQPWFVHTAGPDRIVQTQPNTAYSSVPGDDQPQQWNGFLNFDNPNGYAINTAQRSAIEGWFKRFEDVLYNNAAWRDPVTGYRRHLDTRDFADYFILNVLTRNGDGLLLSMFPWKGDDDKLRMGPAWDYNWSSYYVSGGPTGALMHRAEYLWYARLFADPDFQQQYIDRWWDLRRSVMSNAAMDSIINRQAAEIGVEKAMLNGLPSSAEWTKRLGQMKTWLKQRADWIDSNYLRPPSFNQEGGEVPDGFQVIITGVGGTLYVTTDGTDPRASGGGVAPSARTYAGPLSLHAPTLVQARVRQGSSWSGLSAATFSTPQDLAQLILTEIMYNPPAAGAWASDDLQFLELKNAGSRLLHLGNFTLRSGITFTFTNGTGLPPGEHFVLARNLAAFQDRYPGVTVRGLYTGKLSHGGETLELATPTGSLVWSVTYSDRAPWPIAADGFGFSAVPQETMAVTESDGISRWRASAAQGGSPGADDPPAPLAPVLINEILTHSNPPEVDAIELFNPNGESVDISGWFLSDDGGVPRKFRIPNDTVLPALGYRVFTEADFNPSPASALNFALASDGDEVYLTAADSTGQLTGFSHGVKLGAAAAGVTFGHYVNSVEEEQFPPQQNPTFGEINAGPLVGPVVVTEIHYHPEAGGVEHLRLSNLLDRDVPLFDLVNPAQTWRIRGFGFVFPTNTVLSSHGQLVVAATNLAAFRALYAVPENVQVFEAPGAVLQDDGERLELQRPGLAGTNGVPYITVDEVRYGNHTPWPPAANGGGSSLQRKIPAAYGNDPTNWMAALPTILPLASDTDRDALPDWWEAAYGFDPTDPTDSSWDADGDGMSNWQEYVAGTNPTNQLSCLSLDSITVLSDRSTVLGFWAVSNKTYSIEYADTLPTRVWFRLGDIFAGPSNRVETLGDSDSRTNRFYRLVTPRQP